MSLTVQVEFMQIVSEGLKDGRQPSNLGDAKLAVD